MAQTAASQLEFERQLKVAWSCLKDVESKVDEIRKAKDASDREVNEGTFRGTIAMTALQGKLEGEFNENLDMAWKSAEKASELDGSGHIQIAEGTITPNTIKGAVCSLRGDLKFALEKWEEAVNLYNQALQYVPDDAGCYYNIGASYTNKHEAASAMSAFHKVIELEPTGRLGIEAAKTLEKLKAGKLGKKAFSGSWIVLGVLGLFTVTSFFLLFQKPGVGVFGFIFWGGILALYWHKKFK